MKTEHQFKPGDKVLVEAEYCDCYGESAWVATLYEDAIPYEGTSMNVARSHIHPAPLPSEVSAQSSVPGLGGQPINGLQIGTEIVHRAKIIGFYDDGTHVRLESDGWEYSYDANLVSPAPREGEYRLTVDELYSLAHHVDRVAGDACGEAFSTACEDAVDSWLSNRKDAGNE